MPAYLKTNSFGEFIFDWSWAAAYERAGMDYYPKLVCAVPFTPATGPRLLTGNNTDTSVKDALVQACIEFVREQRLSSAHWLFPRDDDRRRLAANNLLLRLNYQYHWRNRGYADFEHYLSFFRSRKRKQVRHERAGVYETGVRMRVLHGHELDERLWDIVYGFYQSTFLKKGNYPALTLGFFKTLAETMGENIVIILAEYRDDFIAGSICFRSDDTLYGRYWGCNRELNHLHFETCFYRGIEYCIAEGLQRFEPGAQGEHKITREFLPTDTWSAHWIGNDRFRHAIADFLMREQAALHEYKKQLDAMSPFHHEKMP
jgi:predicted N-acyltransferase